MEVPISAIILASDCTLRGPYSGNHALPPPTASIGRRGIVTIQLHSKKITSDAVIEANARPEERSSGTSHIGVPILSKDVQLKTCDRRWALAA